MQSIRGKSIVIFQYQNSYLFTVCYENTTDKLFYIPVGGGIEFGEYSFEAAEREILEEVGLEIENLQLIDVSENIFTYNGIDEHEIVFAYKADFKNKAAYRSTLQGGLNDKGSQIKFAWATIQEIKDKKIAVYPMCLLEILEKSNKPILQADSTNR